MITIEQATKELTGAVADTFPENAFSEWRRDIVILVDTPLHVDPKRPNQRAREILLRFGTPAMGQYRAADRVHAGIDAPLFEPWSHDAW